MNDQAFENKVNHDVNAAKKDIATLRDDGITGLNRSYEHLASSAKATVADVVKTANLSIGHGLSQYNTSVQDAANKFPGTLGAQATRYPWVTATVSLVLGLLIGIWLKPARHVIG